MFDQPGIKYHSFQMSLFYIIQFKPRYYFNFQLPQFTNLLYFLRKKCFKRWFLTVFQQFLEPWTSFRPFKSSSNAFEKCCLACFESSRSRIAGKKIYSLSFQSPSQAIGVKICYLIENSEKNAFSLFARFFKNLTIYFPIQPTKSAEHPQKLRA